MDTGTAEPTRNETGPQFTVDVEKQPPTPVLEKLDIEHALVHDDPRNWSSGRKWVVLVIISSASMVAGLSANIQNPANQDIQKTLHASSSQISWSLSLSILVQGCFPLIWSAISEIKGRKIVYLLSFAVFATSTCSFIVILWTSPWIRL